jgi:hypothetical protein
MTIKPCPFCGTTPLFGDEAAFGYPDGDSKWGAVKCCCYGPEVRTGYEGWHEWRTAAVEVWNERAERDQLQADNVELRRLLRETHQRLAFRPSRKQTLGIIEVLRDFVLREGEKP